MEKDPKQEAIIKKIVQACYNVRGNLNAGYLESVYKNALLYELNSLGLYAESEKKVVVFYKDIIVGEFRADILVEGSVIIEVKAVEALNQVHEVQLVNYLTATGINDGILVNFGNRYDIKRKFRETKTNATA